MFKKTDRDLSDMSQRYKLQYIYFLYLVIITDIIHSIYVLRIEL